jgi:3-oxoacyl-[acyl-carrier protein] reductase
VPGDPVEVRQFRDWSNFIAGRSALVTGSGGGVGRAIAIQMARAGAHVWVNDLHRDRAEQVCEEIRAERNTASPVIADVTDGAQVVAMLDETGPVDILVNNAGIPPEGITVKRFVETGPDEWDPLIRLNLAAVLGVTRAYLPPMIEQGWGRILTIVSDAGRKGERKQVVYGAAKAAAMGFSRGLAAEVGRDGVTVNCLSLGTMRHGLLADAIERDPSLEGRLAKAYPVGRIGRVEDPAPLAVLLCSDAASWITGQVYPVDGGYAPAL